MIRLREKNKQQRNFILANSANDIRDQADAVDKNNITAEEFDSVRQKFNHVVILGNTPRERAEIITHDFAFMGEGKATRVIFPEEESVSYEFLSKVTAAAETAKNIDIWL